MVGGQRWWPKEARKMKINNMDAFTISVETVLNALANHPKFTGLVIVRLYSPRHYEGGAWNAGGPCTGQVQPATVVARDEHTDVMHDKQAKAFHRAVERLRDSSRAKLRLMDITAMFGHRRDGHPAPYRFQGDDDTTERRPGTGGLLALVHARGTWNEIFPETISRHSEKQ